MENTDKQVRSNSIEISNDTWLQELNSHLKGKVRWDVVTLQLYSTAACFYDITPLAVVIPENINDIITAVNICAKYKVPILPRGAGSSLSGNAVNKAVVLDLSKNFRNMEILDNDRVKCDVGIVLNYLQEKLKPFNKKFAPDPSSGNACVIGGMLGNNSGGPHTIKHGNMYRHTEQVTTVLPNGKIFNARNIPLNEISKLDDFHRPYYEKAKALLQQYSEEIESCRPASTKNASGYQVWDILTETHLNMASMLVGSEGTLGIFTDAVLKVIPNLKYHGIISLYFTEIEKMGRAVKHLRELGASSIEFVDQSFIRLALSFRPELSKFLPENVKYLLYVEYEDNNIENIEKVLLKTKEIIGDKEKLADVGSYSTNEDDITNIMRVRKAATVILNKIQGKEKPVPFVEDAAINPDVFGDFLSELSKLLQTYNFRYAIFGHAGDGNLHLRPILNFKNKQNYNDAVDLMEKFVDLVMKYGGSLSGEHADGRLRTPYYDKKYSKLLPLFKEIKNLFDPEGIMNPGIKVPKQKFKWNENLRYTPDYTYTPLSAGLDMEAWRTEIEKCHGCGTCREYCPVFNATGLEEATGRAKANILRGIISGKISTSTINDEHVYQIMNFCLNCGQCLTDCPTGVNIPGIVVYAKEKLRENRPFKLNEFILQRGKLVSSLAASLPAVSNTALSIPLVKKIMHHTAGIHSERNFPKFKRQPKDLNTSHGFEKKVVLWTGCSANYNDPDGELKSSIEILNKLQYDVILPDWKCCNVARLSYGNFKDAKDEIEFNLKTLLPYVNQNIPVVFTSASCGYAFMHEYRTFFGDREDIKKVAESSYDIHNFLGKILTNGEFKNSFTPIDKKIVYHAPCHLKTQRNNFGPVDLLKLIPGLQLLKINDSCCGIAGTFGMKKENFDLSMKIGSRLFSEVNRVSPDMVLSGCGTCQIQINQGTGLEVIHPVVLINRSFQPGK